MQDFHYHPQVRPLATGLQLSEDDGLQLLVMKSDHGFSNCSSMDYICSAATQVGAMAAAFSASGALLPKLDAVSIKLLNSHNWYVPLVYRQRPGLAWAPLSHCQKLLDLITNYSKMDFFKDAAS